MVKTKMEDPRSAGPWNMILFLFSALTLSVGAQERHPVCKKLVGKKSVVDNDVTGALHVLYCKTRVVCVPFISRISRPWQPRENNGSLIYILAAIS